MDLVTIKDVGEAIRIGYGGKTLGNTNPGFGSDAAGNFAKFIARFADKTVYDMPAVGKDNVVDVDKITPGQLGQLEADVLITRDPSVLLVLKAADCIPLVLYVPGQRLLALAHVGTPGAVLHLPSKAVQALSIAANKIHCYVGPSISHKSYRFPEDQFDKKLDDSWDKYITREPDGVHIDLLNYVLDELKANGIKEENIKIEGVDTGGDPLYFSHRRHRLSGEPDGRNTFGVCLL
jgi:copper oxidase (laccase) domain-containing protein